MKLKITVVLIILCFSSSSFGQNIIKSKGQAQVKQESYMSRIDATEKAIELAKINAIEQAFGTYVEQQMDMLIQDDEISYHIIGSTKVKGEWIETLGEPEIKIHTRKENTNYGRQDVNYISCKIKGKVRALAPRAILKYEIMNAPDVASRTRSFYNKEQLYIYFKSPVAGYVSIFLQDKEAVYRLLPYSKMSAEHQNGVYVKGDTEYVFFSPLENPYLQSIVDEMIMTVFQNKPIEYNQLYIVFSEEAYIKPTLTNKLKDLDRIIPASLTKQDFKKWLSHNRISHQSFQVIKEKISIKPRK